MLTCFPKIKKMFGNYNKKFRTKLLKRDKNIKRKIRK